MAAIYSKSVTHTFGLNSIIMCLGSLLAKIGIIIYILDLKKMHSGDFTSFGSCG